MTRRNHPKRQEDRKERAKHGLDGDDEDLMKDLMQMEASRIRFPPLKQRIPADWNLDEFRRRFWEFGVIILNCLTFGPERRTPDIFQLLVGDLSLFFFLHVSYVV